MKTSKDDYYNICTEEQSPYLSPTIRYLEAAVQLFSLWEPCFGVSLKDLHSLQDHWVWLWITSSMENFSACCLLIFSRKGPGSHSQTHYRPQGHEDPSTIWEYQTDLWVSHSVWAAIIMRPASRVSSSPIKVIRGAVIHMQPYGDTEDRWAVNGHIVDKAPRRKLNSLLQGWSAEFRTKKKLYFFLSAF